MAKSKRFDGKHVPNFLQLCDQNGVKLLGDQGAAVSDGASATVAALTQGSAAVVVDSTTVDASAGGTSQTANCTLIPANSLLIAVYATVVTPFDGDTTQTLEVGVTGNADNYIDTSDFDPSAAADTDACNIGGTTNDMKVAEFIDDATQIEAEWTNDASASAGDVTVTVVYVPLQSEDLDTQVDALIADVADIRTQLNALLARLRAHGVIAT